MEKQKKKELAALIGNAVAFLCGIVTLVVLSTPFIRYPVAGAPPGEGRWLSGYTVIADIFKYNYSRGFVFGTMLIITVGLCAFLVLFAMLRTRTRKMRAYLPGVIFAAAGLALIVLSVLIFINVFVFAENINKPISVYPGLVGVTPATVGESAYLTLIFTSLTGLGAVVSLLFSGALKKAEMKLSPAPIMGK